jgi:quercetin dioxygenase-like cupin family protein
MRRFLLGAAFLAASTDLSGQPTRLGESGPGASLSVVLENARVRVWKASTARDVANHPRAVVVLLEDSAIGGAGEAYWSGDEAGRRDSGDAGPLIIVEPRQPATEAPAAPATGTKPGHQPFTGMSFKRLFENERVAVIRARMELGAEEGFHTHASDVIVVHLSGGAIEDTADGKTLVKHWKHGDVEFEARGSSHSARNLGPAVDVVLVTLKP